MSLNSSRFHSVWTRGCRWFAALGGTSTPASTAAAFRSSKRSGQPSGQGLHQGSNHLKYPRPSAWRTTPGLHRAGQIAPHNWRSFPSLVIHAQNSSTSPQKSITAAASSLLVSRGSSGVISRKTPEMKSLVDGSMSTSDEMPYQDRPSSSARPIHISSDCFDHGGLIHSVSRKIRRVMRISPPEELQPSRDCLFQLSILVSMSSVYFQTFGEGAFRFCRITGQIPFGAHPPFWGRIYNN